MKKDLNFCLSEEYLLKAKTNKDTYYNKDEMIDFSESKSYLVFVKNYCMTEDYNHHCLEVVVMNEGHEREVTLVYDNEGEEFDKFFYLYTTVTGVNDDMFESLIGYLFMANIVVEEDIIYIEVIASCGNLLDADNWSNESADN